MTAVEVALPSVDVVILVDVIVAIVDVEGGGVLGGIGVELFTNAVLIFVSSVT